MPASGSKSRLTIYLNMMDAFLTTRSCCPAPPARDMLTPAPSALLHEWGRNGELQSKSEPKGEYPPGLGSQGYVGDMPVGCGIPGAPSCPGAEGLSRGCRHWAATHQPGHSLPCVGCTPAFKLCGPNPCAHPFFLTSIPTGKRPQHPPAQPPWCRAVTYGLTHYHGLLWVGLTAKGGVTLHVWLKLYCAKSCRSAGRLKAL